MKRFMLVLALMGIVGLVFFSQPSQPSQSTPKAPTSSSVISSQDDADLDPEAVAAKEGDHSEQVVVQVTDEGYVMSHGDHYHFYNGHVGFDALISRDLLMTDASYVLEESHIVSDVADGHIIKVGETYYLYVTVENPQNLRE